MNLLRWFRLGCVLPLAGLGLWAVLGSIPRDVVQTEAPQRTETQVQRFDCLKGGFAPEDADGRAAFEKARFKVMAAAQAELAARNAIERKRWRGCNVTAAATPGDAAFNLQKPIVDLLTAIQPTAPNERLAQYDWAISYPTCVLVGWDLTVSRVEKVKDRHVIELLVCPYLASDFAAITTVSYTCKETWNLRSNGELTFQSIEPAGGLMLLNGD